MRKFAAIFLLILSHFQTALPSERFNNLIEELIEYTNNIVTYMPEIGNRDGEKFHLFIDRIDQLETSEIILMGDDDEVIIDPQLISVDKVGPYLALSPNLLCKNLAKAGNKIFKNVCYDCKYEWPGGFAFRCPSCGSTNIGNKINR